MKIIEKKKKGSTGKEENALNFETTTTGVKKSASRNFQGKRGVLGKTRKKNSQKKTYHQEYFGDGKTAQGGFEGKNGGTGLKSQ